MNINSEYNDPKNSLVLFELGDKLDFLIHLHKSKKFPKVLMISGKKGVGKFTLILFRANLGGTPKAIIIAGIISLLSPMFIIFFFCSALALSYIFLCSFT